MTWSERITLLSTWFSLWDFIALAVFVAGWLWIGWRIENPPKTRPSVSQLMSDFRREWMDQMVERNPRIFDSMIVSSLRQATAFFASATMIALGGGLALVGNPAPLADVAEDLILTDTPDFIWEIKILCAVAMLTNAFLAFVWSHRLFGYSSVLMAAVPNDPAHKDAFFRARQAAEVNIAAARNFNRGLRSTYFSLAALAWMMGAVPLIAASVATIAILYRREFASRSRSFLMEHPVAPRQDTNM